MNTKKGSQPLNFNPKGPLQSLDGENREGKRRKPRGKTASLNLGFSRIIALFSQFYLAVFGIFAVLPRGFSRFSWFLRSKEDCAGPFNSNSSCHLGIYHTCIFMCMYASCSVYTILYTLSVVSLKQRNYCIVSWLRSEHVSIKSLQYFRTF